jgi:hypothetical protein
MHPPGVTKGRVHRGATLARVALWGAAAPIVFALLVAVLVGDAYVPLLHVAALPTSLLVGVGLGLVALAWTVRDRSGAWVVAAGAIVIGGLSGYFLLYVFVLNPH